ncbi:unnamed protein product, partial [marine sediment metagenome]
MIKKDLTYFQQRILGQLEKHFRRGNLDLGHISKLEYGTATGSEKVEFGNYTGEFSED